MLLVYVDVNCSHFSRVTCRTQVDAVLKDIREHLVKELDDQSTLQTLSSESTIKTALQNLLSSSSASVPAASHKVNDCKFKTCIFSYLSLFGVKQIVIRLEAVIYKSSQWT